MSEHPYLEHLIKTDTIVPVIIEYKDEIWMHPNINECLDEDGFLSGTKVDVTFKDGTVLSTLMMSEALSEYWESSVSPKYEEVLMDYIDLTIQTSLIEKYTWLPEESFEILRKLPDFSKDCDYQYTVNYVELDMIPSDEIENGE